MTERKLTPKQERFVEEYLIDLARGQHSGRKIPNASGSLPLARDAF